MNPKDAVFVQHIVDCCSHRIHANVSPCTKRAGEEPRDTLQPTRNIALWPRDTRQEQQRYGNKHHDKHHVLAILDETRHHDTKEDTCQRVGQHDGQQRLPRSQLREVEQPRNGSHQPSTHHGINHKVAQGLAQNDGKRRFITFVAHRHQCSQRVLLTCRTSRKTNAKHQRLLQYQYQYGRQDKRAIAALRIEYRHIFIVKRFGRYSLFARSI